MAVYCRTNLTMRRLGPLFGVSHSAVHRVIDTVGPLLALAPVRRRSKEQVTSSSRSYKVGKYDHNYERGANNTLVHYWYEDGWHRAVLPGSIVRDPVAYFAADHDHVYGRTANGDLQHRWFVRGEGWKTANLGGDITGNPTALYANGYHHVYARTTNGDLYH